MAFFPLQNITICQKQLLIYDKDINDETECMLQDPLLSSSEKFDVSTTIFTLWQWEYKLIAIC